MKTAALNLVLLPVAGVVAGQKAQTGGSATPTAESSPPSAQTFRGRLSKAGDTHVLLGGLLSISDCGGDTEALKGKLGHTVEVTGPV